MLSHPVQEKDMRKRSNIAHLLLDECTLPPSLAHHLFPHSSFTKSISLLHFSTSSFTLFSFSVSRDVSQPCPNSPATLLNPPSQSNSNSIPNNGGPDQWNSSKSRKSSSALECLSEEGGTLTHAYGKTLHKAAVK